MLQYNRNGYDTTQYDTIRYNMKQSYRICCTLTSQVWLSRLTAAVLRPIMMANAEFKFLWALQLQTQHAISPLTITK